MNSPPSNIRLQRTRRPRFASDRSLSSSLTRRPLCRRTHSLVLVGLVSTLACCWSPGYEGDGRVVTHGFSSPFRLELGIIDLGKIGSSTFHMKGLAGGELLIGLVAADSMGDAVVRFSMSNHRYEVVIDEQGPLSSWRWERGAPTPTGFVYRAGKTRDVPIPGTSSVNVEAIGVRANGGWGTYFKPVARASFTLRVDVQKAASASPASAPLVVKCVVGSL